MLTRDPQRIVQFVTCDGPLVGVVNVMSRDNPSPGATDPVQELLGEPAHGPVPTRPLGRSVPEELRNSSIICPGKARRSAAHTDGLIERPGEDIGRGLTRLRQHTAALAVLLLQEICDELLARLTDGHHDDVAILALRVLSGAGHSGR